MRSRTPLIQALSTNERISYRKGVSLRVLDGILLGLLLLAAMGALASVNHVPVATILAMLVPIYVAILLLRSAIGVRAQRLCYSATYRGGVVLRRRVLEHLTRLPVAQFRNLHSGKIAQILSEDIMWMENHTGFFRPTAFSDFAVLGLLSVGVVLINWPAALAAGSVWVLGYLVLHRVRAGIARGLTFRSAGLSGAAKHFVEYAEGIQVIRAFGTNVITQETIERQSERMRQGFRKAILRFTPVLYMIQGLAFAAVAAGAYAAVLSGGEAVNIVGAVVLLAATLIPVRSIISG